MTIAVNVHDAQALHAAAMAVAMKDCSKQQGRELLGTARRPDIAACLVMLLDPGISPPGTSIEASECDSGIDLD